MAMRIEELVKALDINRHRKQALQLIRTLNEINGGDMTLSMPCEVFEHVDRQLAAKGLLSLMIEAVAEYERQLRGMGIETGG